MTTSLTNNVAVVNETFSITCSAHANPPAKYLFYKGNEFINDADNDAAIITSVNERAGMVIYSCIPFNIYGNGTRGALAVTVRCKYSIVCSFSMTRAFLLAERERSIRECVVTLWTNLYNGDHFPGLYLGFFFFWLKSLAWPVKRIWIWKATTMFGNFFMSHLNDNKYGLRGLFMLFCLLSSVKTLFSNCKSFKELILLGWLHDRCSKDQLHLW